MEVEIEKALDVICAQLKENEVVKNYQNAKAEVLAEEEVVELQKEVAHWQKEIVQSDYFAKPEAKKVAHQKADEEMNRLQETIEVQSYQAALQEANDLVQALTKRLEENLEEPL